MEEKLQQFVGQELTPEVEARMKQELNEYMAKYTKDFDKLSKIRYKVTKAYLRQPIPYITLAVQVQEQP